MSRQHDSHTFDMFGEAASAHPALSSTPELLALCERWVARGWLRDLDRALVRFLASEAPDFSPSRQPTLSPPRPPRPEPRQ